MFVPVAASRGARAPHQISLHQRETVGAEPPLRQGGARPRPAAGQDECWTILDAEPEFDHRDRTAGAPHPRRIARECDRRLDRAQAGLEDGARGRLLLFGTPA
ncbi:hypothetical protein AB5I41_27025 [Sphingomonas sp. MMS24-JH45]